jgi:hypothetical protein
MDYPVTLKRDDNGTVLVSSALLEGRSSHGLERFRFRID